ncbi:MAG: TVP38/TMEM64 family protein [Candidatus Omnitrophica bacterium]|nr:TVP38/TMEM64 family protein [Candidatus Omnitrophota bacterium]
MALEKYRQELRFFIFVLALLLLWYLSLYLKIDIPALTNSLSGLPLIVSFVFYILLYVAVTFFIFFSKDIFWLTGALLFGPYLSALLICIAELINACILFNIARFLGRGYVERKLSQRYSFLDGKLSSLNILWLIIFRAAPLVPYRFLDLAAGLTGMRFRKYFVAVLLGTPLKIFWVQYIIYAVGKSVLSDSQALTEYFLNNKPLFLFSFIYIILLILVIFKMLRKD